MDEKPDEPQPDAHNEAPEETQPAGGRQPAVTKEQAIANFHRVIARWYVRNRKPSE